MSYRLGIDIGGTFTDATLIDEHSGNMWIDKVLSTPEDPSVGFLQAMERILGKAAIQPADIAYLVHATTVATNAVIEGKVSRTAFLTTVGFRDMLEIARQTRPSLYDLRFEKVRPLVPRHLCFEIPERLDAWGKVLRPLDEKQVRRIAATLRQEKVQSVAVCLLHSYVNSVHEERVEKILREETDGMVVSISSRVAPEIREYFRASTTVINAAVRPVVERYLEQIEAKLHSRGVRGELLVMQSSGGVLTFETARQKPVYMVESGPAAGVMAAAYLGEVLCEGNIISFDMGGTTAKVGLILDGKPALTKEYEVGAAARAGTGSSRGTGYPLRTPVIDLVEIGAGGGSLAWVDAGGILRVGPQSAGADPGPACYRRGGNKPTVTDANLVLGRLNPDYFLGGEIRLDPEASYRAIERFCAGPLGMEVVETANGIVAIANAAMVNALRLVSLQKGYDPREFLLVAFGGAGPVHGNRLADQMEIPRILIPQSPGVASSLGLLVTDLKHDYAVTMIRPADRIDLDEVEALFQRLTDEGSQALQREGIGEAEMVFQKQFEMRYVGQSFELVLPLPSTRLKPADMQNVSQKFHREHDRAFGYSAPEEPVELVNLRLTAIGRIAKPQLRQPRRDGAGGEATQKGARRVYFAEAGGFVQCSIYDRLNLPDKAGIDGPAIIEDSNATTVLHPGYTATTDRWGNIIIRKKCQEEVL